MQKTNPKKKLHAPQEQERPGMEYKMDPVPDTSVKKQVGKLDGRIAFITGADSGIGKAVALLFAEQGADVVIVYLNEHEDAAGVKEEIENTYQKKCLLIAGDISDEKFCKEAVQKTVNEFGRIDILVNNAAIHYETKTIDDVETDKMIKTFATNIFSMFWLTKAAVPYMKKGSAIVNTTSVTAYRGSASLLDYSATKGAIVSFTRSLSSNLVEKGIRVNAVAPGPIWTPLIASSFDADKVASHGSDAPMKRAGEPSEVAPAYLFLASDDASYITGQVIHVNGGEIVNG